jgi:hypothetical protein
MSQIGHQNPLFTFSKWSDIVQGSDSESGSSWNATHMHSMKWRWLPINDPFVDAIMSRDADSLILQREVDSVSVWLDSDRVGHIMRGNLNSAE